MKPHAVVVSVARVPVVQPELFCDGLLPARGVGAAHEAAVVAHRRAVAPVHRVVRTDVGVPEPPLKSARDTSCPPTTATTRRPEPTAHPTTPRNDSSCKRPRQPQQDIGDTL